VGLHVAHADRSATKWAEAEANHRVLQQVMDQPVNTMPQYAFVSASKRPVRSIHRKHRLGPRALPAKWYDVLHKESSDPERLGQYLFALGRYKETADIYRHLKREKTTKSTALKLARTLRAAGHQLECIENLNEAISIFGECSSLLVEVARTFAEIGNFEAAHDYFRRASSSATTDPIVEYISGCSLEDHRRRGEKHEAIGFYSVAARDFEAILMRQPTDVSANERWSVMTDGLHRQQKSRPEC
jgi:tetratricopeptide (TPR) repeat protein